MHYSQKLTLLADSAQVLFQAAGFSLKTRELKVVNRDLSKTPAQTQCGFTVSLGWVPLEMAIWHSRPIHPIPPTCVPSGTSIASLGTC